MALSEERRKQRLLQRVFDVAIALLTILISIELYFYSVGRLLEETQYHLLKIHIFIPIGFVLVIWRFVLRRLRRMLSQKLWILLTEICWSLLGISLFLYLGLSLSFTEWGLTIFAMYAIVIGPSLLVIISIHIMYKRAYRSITDYYKEKKWIMSRLILLMIAYLFLFLLILSGS